MPQSLLKCIFNKAGSNKKLSIFDPNSQLRKQLAERIRQLDFEHIIQSGVNKMFEQKVRVSVERPKELEVYILGDSKVGKTSLAARYLNNSFQEGYLRTREETCPKGKRSIGGREQEI